MAVCSESNITVAGGFVLFTASFHLPPGTFSSFFARLVIVGCSVTVVVIIVVIDNW